MPSTEPNLETLSKLQNKQAILSYLKPFKRPLIGTGEYRLVYDLGNGAVLKLAKDEGGQEANSREYTTAQCLGETYAMKVMAIHPTALWLVAEKLKATIEDDIMDKLLELLSPNWDHVPIRWLPDVLAANSRNLDVPHTGKFKHGDIHDGLYGKNQWYTGLMQGLVKCQAHSGDLALRNWGIRPSSGEPVILDLGGDGY